jgi:hypothetical protein
VLHLGARPQRFSVLRLVPLPSSRCAGRAIASGNAFVDSATCKACNRNCGAPSEACVPGPPLRSPGFNHSPQSHPHRTLGPRYTTLTQLPWPSRRTRVEAPFAPMMPASLSDKSVAHWAFGSATPTPGCFVIAIPPAQPSAFRNRCDGSFGSLWPPMGRASASATRANVPLRAHAPTQQPGG